MVDQNKGLSYLDAGVDIGAGNELVKRIKPSIKKTIRPGTCLLYTSPSPRDPE